MQDMVGKKVEVVTPDIVYSGVLVEIGESEVQLQSETGWIVVRVDRIVDIRLNE